LDTPSIFSLFSVRIVPQIIVKFMCKSTTAGFRNRDIRLLLHPSSRTASSDDQKRLSAKTSRALRLLRAHGLIKKINKTHRYQLTERGRLLTAAARATRNANLKQLLRDAA
jgi:chromosome condensin MukBEF MukE localization factor